MTAKKSRCRSCGAESAWPGGFIDQYSVLHGPHQVCVTCYAWRKTYRYYYLSWLFWTVFALAVGYRTTGGSIEGTLLVAVGLYVSAYLSIVLHELGHWFAAAAVGVPVAVISFGGGPRTKALKFRDTLVLFGVAPSEGLILPVHRTARKYRWKQTLIVAAGPALSAAVAAHGLFLLGNDGLRGYAAPAVLFWTIINGGLAVTTLLPFKIRTAAGAERSSDGAQLLALPRMGDERIDEVIRSRQQTLAFLEYLHGDMNAALAIIDRELQGDAASAHSKVLATAILAETGKVEECIAAGRQYLDDENLPPMERAMLQNNVAFVLYLTRDPGHLEEADELSAMSMEVLPMALAVISTRGAVLVARGRYREGVDLLTDKRFRLETRSHRASAACNRAKGQAHLGRLEEAEESLRTAVSLDPGNRELPAAREAIAAAAERPQTSLA